MKVDRRSILKALSLGAVGRMLPWTSTASAQSGEVPLRILFVEVGHGARRTTWEPPVDGPTDPPEVQVMDNWEFKPVMAALPPIAHASTCSRTWTW